MSAREDESQEARLTAILIAYDESLRSDTLPQTALVPQTAVPPLESDRHLTERLRQSKACLELLDRVRRFEMHTVVESTTGLPEGAPHAAPAESSQHACIGRFQILRELGHGGLGVVLLAFDPQLRRQVAVKIPRPDVTATDESRRRFLREAEATARLSHRNLVAIHEVGQDGSMFYLVSEYCTGPTLADWLQRRQTHVAPRQAASLVRQLAEAVQHAHSRGVLHRDIKPSNVLLEIEDSESIEGDQSSEISPKLTDFGLAKILEGAENETRTGAILGTPAYMAPEQVDTSQCELDARVDVYALGAVLYELLTRSPPFRGSSDIDTLRQLVVSEPTALRGRRADVPRDLEAICLKCLSRDRADRYTTAQELADDLERFLLGIPTEARPLSTAAIVWKWARRRPTVAALLALLMISSITIFSVVIGYNARLRDEIVHVEEARRDAERSAAASRRLLYASDVRIASESLKANSVAQTLQSLKRQIPGPDEEDLREFAWYYLRDQCDPVVLNLKGHTAGVFSVAYSPDGQRLATASQDGTARVWDATSGKTLQILRGHTSEVTSVAFSPDGRTLATGSEDHTVRFWNPTSGQILQVLEGHTDHVMALAFSPDHKYLASGSRDNTIRIWETATGQMVGKLESNMDVIRGVTFVPNQPLLCACDELGGVYLWDTATWHQMDCATIDHEKLFTIAASREGTRVIAAGRAEKISVWELFNSQLHPIQGLGGGHTEWIRSVAFGPGDTFASGGADAIIRLWRTDETTYHRTLLGHQDDVWSLAWAPDGSRLASAGSDGARVWSIAEDDITDLYPVAPLAEEVRDAVYSSDGRSLITGTQDGNLCIWNAEHPWRPEKTSAHGERVMAVRISPDDALIATRTNDRTTRIWQRQNLEEIFSLPATGISDALAWAPSSHRLATTVDDNNIVIIDAESQRIERRLQLAHKVRECLFTPDGSHLVTTSAEALQVWDLNSGRVVQTFAASHWDVVITHDGSLIAADTGSNISLLREAPSFVHSTLVTLGSDIKGLAINGNTLAAGLTGPVRISLWDTRTSQLLMNLELDAVALESLCFSPDGRHLLATGRDFSDRARIWQWSIRKRP